MSRPGDFVIAGGIFILVFFTGTWFISNIAVENSGWVDDEQMVAYNNTFNKYAEYNTKISELEAQTTGTSGASGDSILGDAFSFINNLVNGAWNTVKLLGTNFSFIYALFTGLTSVFGIPAWFIVMVTSLLVAVLVFGLLALIFGRETMGK